MKLAILGAGGHGRVIADAAITSGRWREIQFFDDNLQAGDLIHGWKIKSTIDRFFRSQNSIDGVVTGIGDNKLRTEIHKKLIGLNCPIATIKHPTSSISPRARIGKGVVVFAGSIINIGAKIGDGCIINTGAIVEHDCHLDPFVHVSPGVRIAGGVTIGKQSWIGIGANIIENVIVGHNSIIGAGSLVLRDVDSEITVVGVPANRKLIN